MSSLNRRGVPARAGLIVRLLGCVSILALSAPFATNAAEAPTTSEPVMEEITVTGMRLADKKALQMKQKAGNIIEAIVADDVGKLPDQNVAEAVKRLPGISVANDQGEGRYVIIRGTSPNLANVTLNNQTTAAPEPDARQVKLDDIPSAMIGSVEVIKSLTPDLDANAIAGQININTVSAFDRNKFFATARGSVGHYELNEKRPVGVDATIGDVFGENRQYGLVLSANYDQRPIRSENLQGSSNWNTIGGYAVPDDFRPREYNLTRKRLGTVANFDWNVSDSTRLYLRTAYDEFKDSETRDQFRVEIPTTITNQTATSGSFKARGTRYVRKREEDDNTVTANLGGKFELAVGTLDLDATYTRAVKKDPLRSEWQFRTGSNAFTATYDLTDTIYQVTPADAAYNPALYSARSVSYDHRKAEENLYQARADYKLPVDLGDESFVKVGAKYLSRHKANDRDYATYDASGFTLASAVVGAGRGTFDGRFPMDPRVSYDDAEAYVASHAGTLKYNLSGSLANALANDYRVTEDISAGYVMASLNWDRLTLIPGVRVEHTSGDFKAKVIAPTSTVNQDYNSFGGKSYTDWFPGINAQFDLMQGVVLRGAVTTAIGRPNYADLPPYITIDTGAATVARGNPHLEPLKSTNYDLAAEYYLPSQGILSVGLFRKDIDNPIYSEAVTVTNGSFGGVSLAKALVTTPRNAASGMVEGIELNASTQATFLPSPFDGFGVSGNLTLTRSEASGVFGRTGKVPMFNQSKRVASAQVYYEKDGFLARVAYSYRSAYLDTVGTSRDTDIYTASNGQLDARIAYDVSSHFQVYLEGANLTDAHWQRYIGTSNKLVETERYGAAFKTGFQYKY
ncbi:MULTISPECIES: TonB-dependent receptor [unclassified Azospirillum]|uniref:TonB-dependent receptor n=1 Tax=unclassified Azospirillum TaxID=2630922 RepID=UPI000B759500|nr:MULTISPECIES: TonB-dependent receptor [unclassified Azospirillum]SNS28143.1 TonB-dependent receptor [Azospirillum sp. RU38E]SNS46676.1 TonB-dependent receptor [Azospirillum sp. RU37A]